MLRTVVRVIGVLCLGGAILAELAWQDAKTKLFPVDRMVTLQAERAMLVPFVPSTGISEHSDYIIELQFKRSQHLSLNCQNIQALNIRWEISENALAKTWESLPDLSPQDYVCDGSRAEFIIRFWAPPLEPKVQHYLYLAKGHNTLNNKRLETDEIRIHVIVRRYSGLDVHYGLVDQAIAFVLEVFFGVLCIICFLLDLALTLRRKLRSRSDVAMQRSNESR